MTSPAKPPTQPHALVSTILAHLPSFRNKPEIAAAALQTVRSASHTSSVQHLSAGLLVPLTGLCLASSSAKVRADSANTCVTLLRALVYRRAEKLAIAYVNDLVLLAHRIVAQGGNGALHCDLPTFLEEAKKFTQISEVHSNTPAELFLLPVNSASLESLMFCLSLIVPSLFPPPTLFTNIEEELPSHQNNSAALGDSSSDGIKLWHCIGEKARTSVLVLASNRDLLDGSCGTAVARAAACIVERAFDPACGLIIPIFVRENLCAIVNEILRESYPSKTNSVTQKVRSSLYRIAQLADPASKIDAETWAHCGIREAAEFDCELGLQLRSFSRCGLVQSYVLRDHDSEENESEMDSEPPLKKRKTDVLSQTSNMQRETHSASHDLTQISSVDEQRASVCGLQKTLQNLRSVDACRTEASCMQLLANACHLVADSIANILTEGQNCARYLEEWLSFASSLSQIVQDVFASQLSCDPRYLDASVQLGRACLRLGSIFAEVNSLRSVSKTVEAAEPSASLDCTSAIVLDSVVTLCGSMDAAMDTSSDEFPCLSFAELLIDISHACRCKSIQIRNVSNMRECCARLEQRLLNGTMERSLHFLLLRCTVDVSRGLADSNAVEEPILLLQRISTFLSSHSQSCIESSADVFETLSSLICLAVGCNDLHQLGDALDVWQIPEELLSEGAWVIVFEMIKGVDTELLSENACMAFIRSLGVLGIHCHRPHAREVVKLLTGLMLHARSTPSVSLSSFWLVCVLEREDMYCDRGHDRNQSDELDVDVEDSLEELNLSWSSDIEDASLSSLVFRQAHIHSSEMNESSSKARSFEAKCSGIAPFVQLLRWFPHISHSKITGLACSVLLSRSVPELTEVSSLIPENVENQDYRRTQESSMDYSSLCSWNHFLMLVSLSSQQYMLPSRFWRESARSCGSSNYRSFLYDKRAIGAQVSDFFNARLRHTLLYCMNPLLSQDQYGERMAELLTEGNNKSFWSKVAHLSVAPLLWGDNLSSLEYIANKAGKPVSAIVCKVVADLLARDFMVQTTVLDCHEDNSNRLIVQILEVSLDQTVRKMTGKIVQRLVMEFGGRKELQAKLALVKMGKHLSRSRQADLSFEGIAGNLVSSNFMLVMDAVNRGLFHSKVTEQGRKKHLQMLRTVITLSSNHLHLYVPKIMATLKMALDASTENESLCIQTLFVWQSFISLLGPHRIVPHLGVITAILMPFFRKHARILSLVLNKVISGLTPIHFENTPSLLLLLRLVQHPSLHEIGKVMTRLEGGTNQILRELLQDKGLTLPQLHRACECLGYIFGHHNDDFVEMQASKYLLRILRHHRHVLSKVGSPLNNKGSIDHGERFGINASILDVIMTHVKKTNNEDCQDILVQCIGELGAVDPVLLPSCRLDSTVKISGSQASVKSYPRSKYGLAASLLNDFLVPTLGKGEKQESSNNRLNRIGLAIQELLRVCGCHRDTAAQINRRISLDFLPEPSPNWEVELSNVDPGERGVLFWENLSGETRNAVEPYLAQPFDVGRYQNVFGENVEGNAEYARQPVWSKIKASNPVGKPIAPQEWTRHMAVQLIDFIGKRGTFGESLRALRPVIRYEHRVNSFVFPIVLTLALDLSEDLKEHRVKEFLIGEVAQVLSGTSSPQPIFDLLNTLRLRRDQRCRHRGLVSHNSTYSKSSSSDVHSGNRKKIPFETFVEIAKENDPLTDLVDLEGRESPALSLLTQAKAAFLARSFHQAIMLAECHIRNLRKKRNFSSWPSYIEKIKGALSRDNANGIIDETESLQILQRAFAEIEDVRNMAGIAALRSKSSLAETMIDKEAAGRYDEALTTYEHAIAEDPRNAKFHKGFLSCLMTLGHWETMLSHAEGLVSSSTLFETDLCQTAMTHGISAAWRLSRWEKLEQLGKTALETTQLHFDRETQASWMLKFTLHFSRLFLSFQKADMGQLEIEAVAARRTLAQPLVRAARESYHRAYPIIALVHTLCDVEDAARSGLRGLQPENSRLEVNGSVRQAGFEGLAGEISRVEWTSRSLKIREPLLSAKRVCFELLNMPNEAAKANLELARLAKDGGNLRAAVASASRALSTPGISTDIVNAASIEVARIRRGQGDVSAALLMVRGEIDRLVAELDERGKSKTSVEHKAAVRGRLCTAMVQAGTWSEETRSETSQTILKYFETACTHGPNREEPFYALGKHFDSLLQAGANADSTIALTADLGRKIGHNHGKAGRMAGIIENYHQYVPLVIRSFARALRNGHTRIFEALPRMLTVWFNFYSDMRDSEVAHYALSYEKDVRVQMKSAMHHTPAYMWMTAIPQLMSRVLHGSAEVREELNDLLAHLICFFPDQCFWMILPSSQLKSYERKKATTDILASALQMMKRDKLKGSRERAKILKVRINLALNIVRSFVSICITLVPKERRGKKENCGKEFRGMKTLLKTSTEASLIMPTLQSLTVQLGNDCEEKEHNGFDPEPVRIVDIEDEVLVMSSLMRPRRISLIGSDGLRYRYLAKRENQGDMRKDSRLVEFITVVNRLMSRDKRCESKKLELKTYAVLPLSEETGMIEWVNDLEALRSVVRSEHNGMSSIPDAQSIQREYEKSKNKRDFLERWAFVKFPPVLDKALLKRFGGTGNAQRWLRARNVWTESCAVWSMAGYIVGLGDRHGENVLLENTSGRCVHVDFAMLFDKGLNLKIAEIVPFRLTRNMVCAMGIGGYEGVFRGVSEDVLGTMRENSDGILSVLESFLHDPLADWKGGERKGGSKEGWEMRGCVKAKLTGMVDSSGLALSIAGQVARLIQEATSIENLSQMYLWWSAWM